MEKINIIGGNNVTIQHGKNFEKEIKTPKAAFRISKVASKDILIHLNGKVEFLTNMENVTIQKNSGSSPVQLTPDNFSSLTDDLTEIVGGSGGSGSGCTKQIKKTLRDVRVGDDLGGKTIYFDTSKPLRMSPDWMRTTTFKTSDNGTFMLFMQDSGSADIAIHGTASLPNIYQYGAWLLSEFVMPANFLVTAIEGRQWGSLYLPFIDIDDPIYFSLSDAWYFEEVNDGCQQPVEWGGITGNIKVQTDLTAYIDENIHAVMVPDYENRGTSDIVPLAQAQTLAGGTHTIQSDGFVAFNGYWNNANPSNGYIVGYINDAMVWAIPTSVTAYQPNSLIAPVRAGDVISVKSVMLATPNGAMEYSCRFIPPVKIPSPKYPAAFVPDYSNMESVNRIPTANGSWTADRNGFVKCGADARTTGASGYIGGGVQINGKEAWFDTSIGASSGQNLQINDIFGVAAGDVITFNFTSGTANNLVYYCYYIPPVAVIPPGRFIDGIRNIPGFKTKTNAELRDILTVDIITAIPVGSTLYFELNEITDNPAIGWTPDPTSFWHGLTDVLSLPSQISGWCGTVTRFNNDPTNPTAMNMTALAYNARAATTMTRGHDGTAYKWVSVSGTNYSTNEVSTGKRWIDGKIIYRKVITGTLGSTAGASTVIGNIVGHDKVVKIDGIVLQGGSTALPVNYIYSTSLNTEISLATWVNGVGEVKNVWNATPGYSPQYVNAPIHIIVDYTKT